MTPMLSKSRFVSGLQCPLRLWFQCYSPNEKEKIRNNLLEYCGRDTMAMVEIRNELLARIENG